MDYPGKEIFDRTAGLLRGLRAQGVPAMRAADDHPGRSRRRKEKRAKIEKEKEIQRKALEKIGKDEKQRVKRVD